MIQRARDWLNRRAVLVLAVASLILAIVSFAAGHKLGGMEWELNYLAMKQACAEELIDQYMRGRRPVPIIPKPEYTRLFI